MIAVKIKGGLGNQMFQYAMARKLQMELGFDRIGLDIARVNADPLREFGLTRFRLCDQVTVLGEDTACRTARLQEDLARRLVSYFVAGRPQEIAAAREKKLEKLFFLLGIVQKDHDAGMGNSALLKLHKNIFINGWFQDGAAAESIRDVLLTEFAPAREMAKEVRDMAGRMAETESVCVHIRRGDYVNHPQFGVCTDDYYFRAMDKMAERLKNPVFYIFSDGMEEVRSFSFPGPVVFDHPDHDTYESIYLMSKCKHFIISNSTFSWWGQFLSESAGKIVIAPDRWSNEGGYQALYSDKWTLLSV